MPIGAKIFDIAFTVFIYLLAVAILIGALLFAFNTSRDKSLFGYRYYTVLTGSMSPKYNEGDMIFVHICSGDDVEEGDVITFNPSQSSDAYLTHRVTEKFNAEDGTICFKTKGDANDSDDSFVIDESRVIGKVTWSIPKFGYVIRFVQLRWYFIIPVVIMIAVFFQLLKRYFMLGKDDDDDKSDKKKNKKPADDNITKSKPEDITSEDEEVKESEAEAEISGAVSDTSENDASEASQTDTAETVPAEPESVNEDELPSEDKPNETSPTDV